MSKYLNKQQLTFSFDYDAIRPLSSDSYNETTLKKKIDEKTDDQKKELFSIALQFSIIGQSQQSGGIVEIDSIERKVDDLIENNDIVTNNSVNDKIEEEIFTPKRLARIFRFEIQNFINHTGEISFLSKKYGDDTYVDETFPCAEYLIEDLDSANHLITVYQKMDQKLNTRFTERIKNVLRVRGIIQ